MSSNVMTTRQLAMYEDAIMGQLNSDPLADATALKAVVDVIDSGQQIERYTQIVNRLKATVALTEGTHGGVVSENVFTSGGTDYTVGQDLPVVDGGSDGVGATATVATIDVGGEILTINYIGGKGYTTPTLDLTAGTVDAVITIQATPYGAYNEVTLVDDMLLLV